MCSTIFFRDCVRLTCFSLKVVLWLCVVRLYAVGLQVTFACRCYALSNKVMSGGHKERTLGKAFKAMI